jgi:hypothetical protein
MRTMAKFLLLVSIQAFILTGCGQSNPLIGEWKDISDEAAAMEEEHGIVLIIRFTETSMIMGAPGSAQHTGVKYGVYDDYVSVVTDNGNEVEVSLEDNDRISMDTPHGRAFLQRYQP